MGVAGLYERQPALTGLPAQHVHGVLDRDGVDLAEERIAQGQHLQLQLAGLGGITVEPCLAAVVNKLRLDIGDDADDALAAQRQQAK